MRICKRRIGKPQLPLFSISCSSASADISAHRIGQKKEVRVLRLISSNTVEELVLARAQKKLEIDGKVIQAGKFDDVTTGAEYEALLVSFIVLAGISQGVGQQLMSRPKLSSRTRMTMKKPTS